MSVVISNGFHVGFKSCCDKDYIVSSESALIVPTTKGALVHKHMLMHTYTYLRDDFRAVESDRLGKFLELSKNFEEGVASPSHYTVFGLWSIYIGVWEDA